MTFEEAYVLTTRKFITEQRDQPDRELAAEYRIADERFPEKMSQAREQFARDHNGWFHPNLNDPTRRDEVFALGLRYFSDETDESAIASYKRAERDCPVLVFLANKALGRDQTSQ